jgi:hypothetical protein
LAYKKLNKEGFIDEPEAYFNELGIAKELKKQFQMEIAGLKILYLVKQDESDIKVDNIKEAPKVETTNKANISIPESSSPNKGCTSKDITRYLNIGKDALSRLPEDVRSKYKIDGKYYIPTNKLEEFQNDYNLSKSKEKNKNLYQLRRKIITIILHSKYIWNLLQTFSLKKGI